MIEQSSRGQGAKRLPVSVLLPVRNEELNLGAALESVSWADEVWVVDSHSADGTVEVAREYTDKVVQFEYDGRCPKKKNWSLHNLPFANEWVLILDADERITADLAAEIGTALASGTADGYYIDRDYVFMGRSLRSFRPNWNLRLFKHRLGRYERLAADAPLTGDNEVHEHVVLDGRVGYLRSPMLHEDRRPLRAWVDNHNRYSDWEVQVYRRLRSEPLRPAALLAGGPGRWRHNGLKRLWVRLPFRPLARFGAFYLLRRGFLDGREGFRYSVLMGFYEYLIGLKLRELELAEREGRRLEVRMEQTWHDDSSPSAGPGERAAPPPGYEMLSRLLDVVVAAAILLLLSPLWLAIAALIRATSPGPALFRRKVAGQAGRPFTYYKFRTMVDGDDSHHRAWLREFVLNDAAYRGVPVARLRRDAGLEGGVPPPNEAGTFKVVGDKRVTGVGKVLRRLSLDEVPQMLNVLRGEMSLVGPRPPIMAEFELYDDHARGRLAVRPGITGLYQVTARSQVPFSRMLAIDLEYIRRRSLALDLSIMLRTAVVMLSGRGAG